MSPLIPIIAQYGIEFTVELLKILQEKSEPKAEDFMALIDKYGTETLSQKLAKFQKPTT